MTGVLGVPVHQSPTRFDNDQEDDNVQRSGDTDVPKETVPTQRVQVPGITILQTTYYFIN